MGSAVSMTMLPWKQQGSLDQMDEDQSLGKERKEGRREKGLIQAAGVEKLTYPCIGDIGGGGFSVEVTPVSLNGAIHGFSRRDFGGCDDHLLDVGGGSGCEA